MKQNTHLYFCHTYKPSDIYIYFLNRFCFMKTETRLVAHMFTYRCGRMGHLSFVSQETRLWLDNWGIGFDSHGRQGIFLLSKVSRPAQRRTLLPVKWVTEAVSLSVKWPEHEVTTRAHLVLALKCKEVYLQRATLSSTVSQVILLYHITQNFIVPLVAQYM
jgi:hypothetical protein